ncbi:MAG: hypothetical protein GYA24_08045 [Candidatus Lokiarchaeota archaeon]|nr:hypothetical protein [Candidatus Lokiarchaeota archaeon]
MALDAFAGFYFELIIIAMAVIWDILTFAKYAQKKNPNTLLLFLMFLNWTIAILFSWLSKYFEAFVYGIQQPVPVSDPNYWIVTRIVGFRISFIFVTVALYISYVLRVQLFEKARSKASNVFHVAFGAVTCALSLFLYGVITPDNSVDRIIVFALVLVYMMIVYLPFMASTLKVARTREGASFKTAFVSLAVMSLFFISVFVCFLVDQLIGVFTGEGYTFFYFFAWISAIIGFVSAYFGYIRPPKK